MKKKGICWLLMALMALSLVGCGTGGGKTEPPAASEPAGDSSSFVGDGTAADTGVVDPETGANADTTGAADPETGDTSAQADHVAYENTGEYELELNNLFRLEHDNGVDRVVCKEETPLPVYIAFQVYKDTSAQELVDGLILQTGLDDATAEEDTIGAEETPCKSIYVERDVDGLRQVQIFYVVRRGEGLVEEELGSILVEVGTYYSSDIDETISEEIADGLEEVLGSITFGDPRLR